MKMKEFKISKTERILISMERILSGSYKKGIQFTVGVGIAWLAVAGIRQMKYNKKNR